MDKEKENGYIEPHESTSDSDEVDLDSAYLNYYKPKIDVPNIDNHYLNLSIIRVVSFID